MSSVSRFLDGFRCFLKGLSWLKSKPLLLIVLYIPLMLGAVLVFGVLSTYFNNFDEWMNFILFEKPESAFGLMGYWLAFVSAVLGIILVCVMAGFLLPSIIASPFYDYVSMKVEEHVTGKKAVEISLTRSLLLMGTEIKKAIFILVISIGAIFIPVLNILVPAWMISWEFYDYPLARRGLSFGERLGIVKDDFWGVTGMSVWFLIPFVQILLMPLAVAGGTILAVKGLENR